MPFDKEHYHWKPSIDYRAQPEHYKVGKGEQGVLLCNPYKNEILPYWRFKSPLEAKQSSEKIEQLFYDYLVLDDFVGADMARKFLQMGFTRARRYANYKGGRKYTSSGQTFLKGTGDIQKAKSAAIFHKKWKSVENNPNYTALKAEWKKRIG